MMTTLRCRRSGCDQPGEAVIVLCRLPFGPSGYGLRHLQPGFGETRLKQAHQIRVELAAIEVGGIEVSNRGRAERRIAIAALASSNRTSCASVQL